MPDQEQPDLENFSVEFPGHEVLSLLGEGGFGEVYHCRELEGLKREVAIKVIRLGMGTREILARFDAEMHALAKMNHDHVARVIGSGATGQERPYFIMDYIDGLTLVDWIDQQSPSLAVRLEMMQQICSGVQHAHSKGIIHRDLKPGNIIITEHEGKPRAKVIDFGLAKALSDPLTDKTLMTGDRYILGTWDYISPEQAWSHGSDVDIRSDVYSLGGILYRLLAGQAPHEGLRGHHETEILRILREDTPHRPSRRLQGLRDIYSSDASAALRSELDWIILKALEVEPDRRYSTVQALSEDIERHLLGTEPVIARPPSLTYRMTKYSRRYRVSLIATGLVFIALSAGISWALVERNNAQRLAEDVLSLSAIQDVEDHIAEAGRLWPAHPDKIPLLSDWIDRGERLLAELPHHRVQRDRLLASGQGSVTTEESDQNWRNQKKDSETVWWHNQLTELIDSLETVDKFLLTENAVSEEYGWSVRKRLAFARGLETGFKAEGAHRMRWEQALPQIHQDYPELEVTAQMGLVPIGRNPLTRLWEFWHIQSGDEPKLDPRGLIEMNANSGIVFVLLPGGPFWMGSQKSDPSEHNFDNYRGGGESPVHEVILSPFFISKYEMTQGQWKALTGENPARHKMTDGAGELHPVESITWFQSKRTLENAGLSLSSEAQWEYSARGGAEGPWWACTTLEGFQELKLGNIGDQAAFRSGYRWGGIMELPTYDDGWVLHAPIGTYPPNQFGLYDSIGNLYEMCEDSVDWKFYSKSPELDPVNRVGITRISRGASYVHSATMGRSAKRRGDQPNDRDDFIGVRPARTLDR